MVVRNKSQEGFTLIEIMVVISIITVLSLMSVKSYLSQKEDSILRSEVVSLVSEMVTARDSIGHGDFGNSNRAKFIEDILDGADAGGSSIDSSAKCVGFEFNENGVFKFDVPYHGKKVWNNVFGRFEFEGCGSIDDRVLGENILDLKIKLSSLQLNSDLIKRFIFIYEPPFGEVIYKLNAKSANLAVGDVFIETLEGNADDGGFIKEEIYNEGELEFNDDLLFMIDSAKQFEINSNRQNGDTDIYDEVVVEFKYGSIDNEKARYIKFDIDNDEISME